MITTTSTFPPKPTNADPAILKPSAQFRQSVSKIVLAIALFVITYLVLLLLAVAVACAMAYAGFLLAISLHQLLVVLFGLSLIFSGVMLVFFLIKFIFVKTPKAVRPDYEITEADQPRLFALIRQVTDETGAPFPKHVYLSPEVNASVFFDSTFWSMFVPVKKNLNIGLGVVNSLNQSEFKAVLAHEFGHFSQRSMRFGSYVYNLNKILYNILYENNGYIKALNTVSKGHSIIRIAMAINYYLIQGIQFVLRKIYVVINKSHMELSRAMEFHADTTAAYVSGSNNVISSLNRTDIAGHCYSMLLSFLNEQLNDDLRSSDIYQQHLFVMQNFAAENNIGTDGNGLPVPASTTELSFTQISIDDPWSSHPLTSDRVNNVQTLNLNAPALDLPAWDLFDNADQLRKEFTDKLYADTGITRPLASMDMAEFETRYTQQRHRYEQNKAYRGLYTYRAINKFDIGELLTEIAGIDTPAFVDFIDMHHRDPQMINALQSDIDTLDAVQNPNNGIKTFDYKGIKRDQKEAAAIQQQLENNLKQLKEQLKEVDRTGFIIAYKAATTDEQRDKLVQYYTTLFNYQDQAVADYDNYTNLKAAMQPVYSRQTEDAIHNTMVAVYKQEKNVKPRIKEIIADETTRFYAEETDLKSIDEYLGNQWVYHNGTYDNNAIGVFNRGLNAYINIISERNFHLKKQLLDYQLELFNNPA